MRRFAVALLVLGCLGGSTEAYGAEAPAPTVSVEGVASVAISQDANAAEADAAYRQGLAAAIADGHQKAEYLATETGVSVGAIQQIAERGGSIECVLPAEEGPLTEYQSYKGAQPDFGSVEGSDTRFLAAPESASAVSHPATATHKKKKHKRKTKAKKAAAVSCTLSTQVGLSYLLT